MSEATYVPILPDLSTFFKETSKGAKSAGQQAGRDFADGMTREVARAERAVDSATKAQERAAGRATDATAKRRIEEQKLNEVLEKGTAKTSEIMTATQRYEKAQRDEAQAAKNAEKANQDLVKKKQDLSKVSDEAAGAVRVGADEIDDLGESALGAAGKIGDLVGASEGIGSKLMGGLKTIGTGALLGVGAKIGSTITDGIGTAFSAGFSRLQSVEQAEKMLQGLGHSTEATAAILDNAMQSVKGTAFGFGEAASMAATFVGAGIPEGEELTRVLTLVGDSAAIAGADFQEMGSIWTKVASGQRMGTEELNQLMDRGLGLLPELQKKYGVTAEEARKMITDGKVSFEDFADVMENMVGGSAQSMGETFGGSLSNMQAALGRLGAKFLEPVFENAPAIFSAVGGAVDKLGEKLDPIISSWSERMQPVFERFAEWIGPALEQSIDGIADGLAAMVGWVQDNATWLKPLVAAAAGAATAYAAWTVATNAHTVATWAWTKATQVATAAQRIFNAVINANKLMLIVTAVGAVVGALVYFFTQTETGQRMWATFTDALATGWDWVTEKIGSGVEWIQDKFASFKDGVSGIVETLRWVKEAVVGVWDLFTSGDADTSGIMAIFGPEKHDQIVNFIDGVRAAFQRAGEIIKSVFDSVLKVAQVTIAVIGTVILTPLVLAWEGLSAAVSWGWENVIKPTLEWMSAKWDWLRWNIDSAIYAVRVKIYEFQMAISALWAEYVQPVLTWISTKWSEVSSAINTVWTWLKDQLIAVWNTIRTAVFDAWNTVVNNLKATWDIVTGALSAAWTWLKDQFVPVWNTIKTSVFDAWNAAVTWVQEKFDTVTGALNTAWTWLKDQLHSTWTWVNTNVFDKMKSTLTSVKDSFGTAVEGIRTLWDRVRSAAAAPVRFIVDTVVNNGLLKAWSTVSGWVGLDPVDPVPLGELGNYAHGTSRVPGPRSVGRDNMRFISVDGRHAINLAGQEGIAHQHVVDAIGTHNWDRLNAAAVTGGAPAVRRELGSFAGGGVVGSITGLVNRYFPMMTITSTYRNTNDHHGSGLAVDFSNGTDTTPQMQAAAAWFAQNYGPGLLELIHSPSPYNIKNGRSVGDGFGFYGAGTMAQHRNHVHVAAPAPLGPPGTPPPDLGDLPAGGFFDLGGMVKGLWDKAIGAIGKWTGGGIIGQVPGAFTKAAASKLWDFIKEKITIFDKGGVWPSGTLGGNFSGADEYVFTNKAMRSFENATESLQVVAKELGVAFQGGDWGYGELASVLGREDWAKAIVNGAARLGEIHRAVDAGVDAANAVWADQAPGQDDWIQAGWDFLGMGDSFTAGLIRKGAEFNALVADYEADMAEADVDDPDVPPVDDEVTVSEPVTVDAPAIEVPSVADTTSDDSGPVATAGGAGDSGLTVVINLDGVEAVRERIEKVEDGVVEIDKELDSLKSERRALDVAANVLLS